MDNLNLSFLEGWNNLSSVETKSIETLKKGTKIIFSRIHHKNIVSIYLKGSFPRREMKKNSDVDVSVIVNSDETLSLLNKLQVEYRESGKLNFEFSGYSIEELKTGKLSASGKSMRCGTARFVRLIHSYILIYGEKLNLEELYQKKDLEHLRNFIDAFHNIFFPCYSRKELGFQDMVKQALWLFELEVSLRIQNFKFKSWKGLLKYFDPDHCINEVIYLRNNKVCKESKNNFILKLKKYLDEVEKEFLNNQ